MQKNTFCFHHHCLQTAMHHQMYSFCKIEQNEIVRETIFKAFHDGIGGKFCLKKAHNLLGFQTFYTSNHLVFWRCNHNSLQAVFYLEDFLLREVKKNNPYLCT
mmetsp:Transcript_32211/g.47207  ORF Transcript_32211/g.47207 Transcript_32211/m.47207 type:complete len:103 (-) Transcript_32211:131-439(-)